MRNRLPFYVLSMFPLSVFAQEVPSSMPASEPASVPMSAPAPEMCGDGILTASESCDDGNTIDGDGCSAICQSSSKPKSAAVAFGLSLGASAASLGVIIAGSAIGSSNENVGFAVGMLGVGSFVVAPSAGHFYAGDKRHGLIFSGVRLGAGAMATAGFVFALSSIFQEETALSKAGGAMFVLGSLGSAGLLVYEIIDAPRSVKRVATAKVEKKASLKLAPMLAPQPDRTVAPGVSLGGRF
jgi:cysteine-rich repeat protein